MRFSKTLNRAVLCADVHSSSACPGISTVPKPYSVDPDAPHIKDNRRLTLKHGDMEKGQPMNLISSGDITQVRRPEDMPSHGHGANSKILPSRGQEEMRLWIRALSKGGILLPRKSELAKQRVKWAEIKRRAVTDVRTGLKGLQALGHPLIPRFPSTSP